ncbi:MAG: redoxin family protein [Ilumatobacter sp.]|uniref:redoxin family protein n=1 Tax=Ilumatobacter sp. TaxID=1967498 RepID=UPI003C795CBD
MEARRVTALVSLGLVGAVVVGLVATTGNGPDADVDIAAPAVEQQPAEESVSEPLPDPTPESEAAPTVEPGTIVQADPDPEPAPETAPPTTLDPNTPDLPNRGPHPEFLDVQEWIQTNATAFDEFDGKVLAVQFWTFGCSNCQATFPHMRDLYAKYAGEDFEVIGVHAPEFDFERDVNAVASEAVENGLVWPMAIDNEKLNFRSWQERRFWPRLFLIDADGNVRYDHIGEGAYEEIDAAVGALINEKNA